MWFGEFVCECVVFGGVVKIFLGRGWGLVGVRFVCSFGGWGWY